VTLLENPDIRNRVKAAQRDPAHPLLRLLWRRDIGLTAISCMVEVWVTV
jgi:hypothetical protein